MFDLFGGGIYLFEVSRIRVRIHWILLAFWAFRLFDAMRGDREERSVQVLHWLLFVLLGFGSILLHELGHCFAARRVGGSADDILLWPLGGLAFCQHPHNWRAQLATAAGGPLVTLAIVAVSYPLFRWLDGYLMEEHPELFLRRYFAVTYSSARGILVEWNFFLLLFNLVPVFPLDGNRIFHALAWAWFARRDVNWGGYGRASRLTLAVSRVAAVAGIAYGIYIQSMMMVLIFVWGLINTEGMRRQT